MRLEIVSPDGILFEGETERVSFPGAAGSFDILPHHAPLIAAPDREPSNMNTMAKKANRLSRADS